MTPKHESPLEVFENYMNDNPLPLAPTKVLQKKLSRVMSMM